MTRPCPACQSVLDLRVEQKTATVVFVSHTTTGDRFCPMSGLSPGEFNSALYQRNAELEKELEDLKAQIRESCEKIVNSISKWVS